MSVDYTATAGFGFEASKDLVRVILGMTEDEIEVDIEKYGIAEAVENCIDKFKETFTAEEKKILSANYWRDMRFGYGTTGSAFSGKETYYILTRGKTLKEHLEGGKQLLNWLHSLNLCSETLGVEDLPFICGVHQW